MSIFISIRKLSVVTEIIRSFLVIYCHTVLFVTVRSVTRGTRHCFSLSHILAIFWKIQTSSPHNLTSFWDNKSNIQEKRAADWRSDQIDTLLTCVGYKMWDQRRCQLPKNKSNGASDHVLCFIGCVKIKMFVRLVFEFLLDLLRIWTVLLVYWTLFCTLVFLLAIKVAWLCCCHPF